MNGMGFQVPPCKLPSDWVFWLSSPGNHHVFVKPATLFSSDSWSILPSNTRFVYPILNKAWDSYDITVVSAWQVHHCWPRLLGDLNLLGFPRYDDCIYIVEYGICSVVAQSLSMHFWDGDMYRKYGKKKQLLRPGFKSQLFLSLNPKCVRTIWSFYFRIIEVELVSNILWKIGKRFGILNKKIAKCSESSILRFFEHTFGTPPQNLYQQAW